MYLIRLFYYWENGYGKDMDDEKRIRVNYIYFGIFFILLVLLSADNIWIRENLSGSRLFFFLYAIGQALTETALLIFVGDLVRRFFGLNWFVLYIGGTFLCIIFHLLDSILDRILDLSVFETLFVFVLQETADQFFYLLDASGIPVWIWMLFFALFSLLPLIGFALYQASGYFADKRPLLLKKEWFLQTFFCVPFAMLLWDFSASQIIHPDTYTDFIKSLPWKFTFLQPETIRLSVPNTLPQPHKEEAVAKALAQSHVELSEKPNIYLFVLESLRGDFVTPETAPHLAEFKKESIHFPSSLSNANGTNMAWFSIFHSQFPFYWHHLQKENWQMGSPALALLKKWGYQIRVISSAQLCYFGLDELLFGKEKHLLASFDPFIHSGSITPVESDRLTINRLKEYLSDPAKQQGQVFIIFLDSTHFDYSWPKEQEPRFSPVATEFAFLKTFLSKKNLEPLKNRYRNAVFYIDGLFGEFLSFVPKKEESVILVTGDHGEEFYERGHIFHGSHLIHEQTHIPLYCKFGTKPVVRKNFISQMDIFPSLVDYLSGQTFPFLKGESIFRTQHWPYAVIARFNACRSPYEFCLHDGKHKLIARFNSRKDILNAKTLKIRSICCSKDQALEECKDCVIDWVQGNFGPAIERLFAKADSAIDSGGEQSDPFPPSDPPLHLSGQ